MKFLWDRRQMNLTCLRSGGKSVMEAYKISSKYVYVLQTMLALLRHAGMFEREGRLSVSLPMLQTRLGTSSKKMQPWIWWRKGSWQMFQEQLFVTGTRGSPKNQKTARCGKVNSYLKSYTRISPHILLSTCRCSLWRSNVGRRILWGRWWSSPQWTKIIWDRANNCRSKGNECDRGRSQ